MFGLDVITVVSVIVVDWCWCNLVLTLLVLIFVIVIDGDYMVFIDLGISLILWSYFSTRSVISEKSLGYVRLPVIYYWSLKLAGLIVVL